MSISSDDYDDDTPGWPGWATRDIGAFSLSGVLYVETFIGGRPVLRG